MTTDVTIALITAGAGVAAAMITATGRILAAWMRRGRRDGDPGAEE